MERISMNQREARRLAVLEQVSSKKMSQKRAAELLGLSISRLKALVRDYRENGARAAVHGNVGRAPHNAITVEVKERVVELYRSRYHDFNLSHFHEKLVEEHHLGISRPSVHRILSEYKIASPRKHRRKKRHHRRNPRSRAGELVQLDASQHDWFELGIDYHAHGAIDDATGRVLGLYFDEQELTNAYFEVLLQINDDTGLPLEFYTDKRGCFRINSKESELTLEEQLSGLTEPQTQFGRALDELGIDLIYANTPQATGRIERLWGTFQDRVIKEMRLEGIKSPKDANEWSPYYLEKYNKQFERPALDSEIAYLPKMPKKELELILCHQEKRVLDAGLSFSYKTNIFVMPTQIKAQPKQIITVLESPRFGIKAKLKIGGKTVVVVPNQLQSRPIIEAVCSVSKHTQDINVRGQEYGRMGKAASPWKYFEF